MANVEWFLPLAATVVIAILGWVRVSHERRRAERAEQELKNIRRRRQAPFLAPSDEIFDRVVERPTQGGAPMWRVTQGNVLFRERDEVSEGTSEGTPVIFVVENRGETAQWAQVKLDGEPIPLISEIESEYTQGLKFLKYPYDPGKRGGRQLIELKFESSGVQDTHVYETFHGRRILKRIDPP